MDAPIKRLVAEFDCTREYPPERYFACGEAPVVETGAGRYREAEARPLARFGYRFPIENAGRPHLAVVRYPDDRRRYLCVMDGTSYDLTTSVFTGFAHPPSGEMQEIRQVFWPRWNDCSILFMTWGHGEPAAAASVAIYELEDLPPLPVPGDPGDGSRREIGIQYEDPCGTGASEGAVTPEEWSERVIAYARHTGQKRFTYPIVWYHGPRFPSRREPADDFRVVVAPDRRQYAWWSTEPRDWVADLLERFGPAGLEFHGALTLLRLGSLMGRMNTDLAAIQAGADTINNVLWNGQVQAGTQDWTPLYNARNYPGVLERYAAGQDTRDFPWVYGEKSGQPYPPGPIFNPVHPVVQEAIVGLAGEIAERYAAFPAFKGISLNVWHATFLWFGSLRAGYDDFTIRLFEAETGIAVPVDAKAPDRFARRHDFLIRACRPAWIAWRCRKVRDLLGRVRDAVAAARPDLRVTLTLWVEMTIPALLGPIGASHQLHARPSTAEVFREGGIDLALLGGEPGLDVDLQLEPARDRGGWGSLGSDTPLEQATMFRDHDFLDAETLAALRALPRPGAFIFNSWVEAWGKHRWFACDADDRQAEGLAAPYGPGGIFRMNSEYPEDAFWWNSQLRITPGFPGGAHFLEHYAHALAEWDALRITRGGLFLDKAHTAEIQRFARAYRALPAAKFETVGASTDPVAVRTLVQDGRRYLYLVNRDCAPVEVEVTFAAAPVEVLDLATGERAPASASWRLVLGPYQLRSLALAADVAVLDARATVPAEVTAALAAEAATALEAMDAARAGGLALPGLEEMAAGIRCAAAEGRWAWLRRALGSYVVRKCRERAVKRE